MINKIQVGDILTRIFNNKRPLKAFQYPNNLLDTLEHLETADDVLKILSLDVENEFVRKYFTIEDKIYVYKIWEMKDFRTLYILKVTYDNIEYFTFLTIDDSQIHYDKKHRRLNNLKALGI